MNAILYYVVTLIAYAAIVVIAYVVKDISTVGGFQMILYLLGVSNNWWRDFAFGMFYAPCFILY